MNSPFRRCNPRTGFRQIANAAGESVADCPSYQDGPSIEEAQANAELIASGADQADATPGPWLASKTVGGGWLVRGGPRQVIVRRPPDEEDVALQIAAARAASDHHNQHARR